MPRRRRDDDGRGEVGTRPPRRNARVFLCARAWSTECACNISHDFFIGLSGWRFYLIGYNELKMARTRRVYDGLNGVMMTRWCSWLSRLPNTQKVTSSNLV